MPGQGKGERLIKQFDDLDNRGNQEEVWNQISEFILPNRGDFNIQFSKGDRRDKRVFDTTAVHANETLAAALHSGLTNPATKWFHLRPRDRKLGEIEAVRIYIEEVMEALFTIFTSPEANFPQQNHELLLDLVAYGTATMYVSEEPGKGIMFNTRHLSEIYPLEDKNGVIDTVYRKFKFTARQAEQMWGIENLGERVLAQLSKDPNEEMDFLHCVMPRKDAERLGGGEEIKGNFPFVSYHVSVDDKNILDEAGFHEMPYLVVRWEKLIGEVYGRSPGWNALSDIRMINAMSETVIRAAQKIVDPPLLMADDGVVMPLQTFPGGTNIGGVSQDGQELIKPLQTGARIDIGLDMMNQRRDAIKKAFFVDQFIDPSRQGTPRSATEIAQIRDDSLRLTGPQVARMQAEYLNLMINRVFSIAQRTGKLPEAPEELDGMDLDIEYVSPLVQNQRNVELEAFNRTVASLGLLVQTPEGQELISLVDGEKLFRNNAEIAGVPLKLMKTEAEYAEEQQDKREAEKAATQQAQMMQAADTAGNFIKNADIDVGGI